MSQIYKTQVTASVIDGLVAHFNPGISRTYTTGSDYAYDMLNHAYGSMDNANHSGSAIVLDNSGSLVLSQSHSNTYNIVSGSDQTFSIWFNPHQTGKNIIAQENELFNVYLTKSHQVYVGMQPINNLNNVTSLTVSGSELWVVGMVTNNNGAIRVFDKDTFKLKRYIAANSDADNFSFFDGFYVNSGVCFEDNDVYIAGLRTIEKYDKNYIFNPTASVYGHNTTATTGIGRSTMVKYFNYGSGTAAGDYVGRVSGLYMDASHFWFTDRTNDRVSKFTRAGAYVDHVDIASSDIYDGCADGTYYYVIDYGSDKLYKYDLATLTIEYTYGSYGSGDTQFANPTSIATDGTHVYIADYTNDRIKKHLCSTGAYVAQLAMPDNPRAIDVDDDFVYVHNLDGTSGNSLHKIEKDLSAIVQTMLGYDASNYNDPWYVYGGRNIGIEKEAEPGVDFLHTADRYNDYKRYRIDGYGNIDSPHYLKLLTGSPYLNDARAILATGSYVYTGDENHVITQWNYSDMSANASFGTYGTSGRTTSLSNRPECFTTDGTYLYITEYLNERLLKLNLSTLAYVGEIYETSGDGDLRYSQTHCLSGSILYISCRDDGQMKMFDKDSLTMLAESGSLDPYGDGDLGWLMHVDDNYIYHENQAAKSLTIMDDDAYFMKFDKNTIAEVDAVRMKNFRIQLDGDMITGQYMESMVGDDNYLYIAEGMGYRVLDKEHMSFVNRKIRGLTSLVSPDTITTGSWHNVTFTIDANDLKLYVDNTYQVSSSFFDSSGNPPLMDIITPLELGTYAWGNHFANMDIGEIKAYNRVLTTTEMSASYAETLTRYYT